MGIPSSHGNRFVTSQRLNGLEADSSHDESRTERVPVVVPTVAFDLGIVPGALKPSARALDFEYAISLLRACLLLQPLKRRKHIGVHRNVAGVTILCFCKVCLLAPEIHLSPDETVLL